MFIDRLLNQGNMPLIQQAVRFASARHKLLLENVANVDTPGYLQKDLSVSRFNSALAERLNARRMDAPGVTEFDDIIPEIEETTPNILFHDRSNRSIEQLMSQGAKNAMYHNMMIELLRKQVGGIESALKERVA